MSGRSRRQRRSVLTLEPRPERASADDAVLDKVAGSAATAPTVVSAQVRPGDVGWLRAAMVVPALLALLLYLRTAAPTITWRNGGADSGDLVVAAATLGIPHPTGYPTYVLLGHLFTWLPVGEVAYRLSVMSAVSAALAVGLVGGLVYLLGRSTVESVPWLAFLAAVGSGLALAAAPLFWSQAVIPEVYALHLAFAMAIIFALVAWRAWGARRWLLLAAAVLGVGLGNHVTLALLMPAGLVFLLLSDRALWGDWLLWRRLGLALAAGLAVYLYLPWRGAQFPALMWGEPYHPAGLLALVTGSIYHRYLMLGTPTDALSRTAHVGTLLIGQLGWPGFVLGVIGAWWLWQVVRPLALAGLIVGGGSVLFAVNYYARDSEVYLLPLFAIWVVALGVGALALANLVGCWLGRHADCRLGLVVTLVVLAGALVQAARSYPQVDASGDVTARDFGRDILAALPPRAIVMSGSDAHTFSLWYAQDVLELRPDVAIVDLRLTQWSWYREALARRHPGLPLTSQTTSAVLDLLDGAAQQGRPLYASDRIDAVQAFLSATGPPYAVRAR